MSFLDRMMLGLALGLGIGALVIYEIDPHPGEAARPAWISGCSAAADGRYYAARCTSGNARYFARASCYKPKVGYVRDYGDYVWPPSTSFGSCPWGYLATNAGWTQ